MFTSAPSPAPLFVQYNMGQIDIFFQRLEITLLALIQNITDILDGVLVFQVYFVGCALYGGVGTVGTVVRPHTGVSHLVSPQGVVVGAGVLTGVTGEGFVSGVFSRVKLQSRPRGGRVTTETAQEVPLLVVDGVDMEPQLPRGTEV